MYYGAISTDIKKSSSNWGTFPKWMEKAVMLTNNVTEEIFKRNEISGGTQLILPNSPEGDAYTLYYTHPSKKDLKEHMVKVALQIQALLKMLRSGNVPEVGDEEARDGIGMSEDTIKQELREQIEEESKSKTPIVGKMEALIDIHDNISSKYDYIGRVYLRIGLAICKDKPIPYMYNEKKSYRGGVIDFSEQAEQDAPYKEGYGMYNHETGKVDQIKKSLDFKVTDNLWTDILQNTQESKPVTGFIIFVHYHFGITEEMVEKNPHLIQMMKDEFKVLHDETNNRLQAIESLETTLVKVKRDSSSMYCLKQSSKRKSINSIKSKQKVELFTVCSDIVSALPLGSSVGICFGKTEDKRLNEVTRNKSTVDYFGPVVNMAARMEFVNWKYPTADGNTILYKHDNRVAYCEWDDITKLYATKNGRERSNAAVINYPFQVDKIPTNILNAGYGDYVYVISKKLHGVNKFKIGDRVTAENAFGRKFKGVIVDINPIDAQLQLEDGALRVFKVRKLQKVETEEKSATVRMFLKDKDQVQSFLYKLKF